LRIFAAFFHQWGGRKGLKGEAHFFQAKGEEEGKRGSHLWHLLPALPTGRGGGKKKIGEKGDLEREKREGKGSISFFRGARREEKKNGEAPGKEKEEERTLSF